MAHRRFDGDGVGSTTGVLLHHDRLTVPLRWRKPRRIFVCSLADLFHDSVPDGYIAQVWEVMAQCPQHTFQILTKRPARMLSWLKRWHDNTGDEKVNGGDRLSPMPRGPEAVREVYSSPRAMLYDWMEGPRWFPGPLNNVWVGTSIESNRYVWRLDKLRQVPAAVRFLSLEPLLGPLPSLDLTGISWVIAGGESGPKARPMHPDWVRGLRDQCTSAGVAFFLKQWGEWAPAPWHGPDGATHAFTGGLYQDGAGRWVENFMEIGHSPTSLERDTETPPGAQGMRRVGKKAAGRELDGREWSEYPGGDR